MALARKAVALLLALSTYALAKARTEEFVVEGAGQGTSNAGPLPHTPIPARNEDGVNINRRTQECAE